jgi:hypothetical protein
MVAVLAEMVALFRVASLQRTNLSIRPLCRSGQLIQCATSTFSSEQNHEVLVERLKNLHELYLNQLQMLLSAEEQIAIASLNMIERVADQELKGALQIHKEDTEASRRPAHGAPGSMNRNERRKAYASPIAGHGWDRRAIRRLCEAAP